jgi:transcriptional regulator with XRE-family HTH domain
MLVALKMLLFRRRISQTKLSREIDIDPSRVSRLIRGQAKARACERRLISRFLEVRESEIFPSTRRARWRERRTGRGAEANTR